MNKLVACALLVLTSLMCTACAETLNPDLPKKMREHHVDLVSMCIKLRETGKVIMKNRQFDVQETALLIGLDGYPTGQKMVREAYNEPIGKTSEDRARAIFDYGERVFSRCLDSYGS